MDEPVWTKSMCNELCRLSQGWGKHAVTNTTELIFHKDKPKDIRADYMRSVCEIKPKKIETRITRLNAGVNLIYYPGEVITPTSDLTTM